MTDRPPLPRTQSEFRRFVREHHPDRGGDAGVFAAGVAAFRGTGRPGPSVVFYRRRRRRDRLIALLLPPPWRRSRRSSRHVERRVR